MTEELDKDAEHSAEGFGATRRDALVAVGSLAMATVGSGSAHAAPGAGRGTNTSRELTGKVAIVTGARNNLGRGFAVALARMGADVLVHYHRSETRKEAEETARLVRAQHVKAALVDGDLGKLATVRKMFDVAQKELGRIDIVVNNAGYIRKKAIAEITEAEFERAVGINTIGLFYCLQEAAKRISDGGRIINIGTSLLGATTGLYGAYAGTKAPVEQFTRALAKELGARGITVNTIAPGAVDTPFFHAEETPQSVDYVKKGSVAGRLATVDEIVGTLEFLASSRSQWISAQTIFVNSAYLAR